MKAIKTPSEETHYSQGVPTSAEAIVHELKNPSPENG
jgi:hypothetical protein